MARSATPLLAAGSVLALGAAWLSGAISSPLGTGESQASGEVGVIAPIGSVSFDDQAVTIPANGSAQRVADIVVADVDANYTVSAAEPELTEPGNFSANCGDPAARGYSVEGVSLDPVPAPPRTKVGELLLTLPGNAEAGCTAYGAVVSVTFTATGPAAP